MAENESSFFEKTWDAILSRKPKTIRSTFSHLDPSSQKVVMEHLKKMATEEGWHPEQVLSARAALDALRSLDPNTQG